MGYADSWGCLVPSAVRSSDRASPDSPSMSDLYATSLTPRTKCPRLWFKMPSGLHGVRIIQFMETLR